MVMHGLYCPQCQDSFEPAAVDIDNLPCCPNCGVQMRTDYSSGKCATTDVCGSTQSSDVLYEPDRDVPLTWTSTRERDHKMKLQGCVPKGDRVGGARNDDGLKGTKFSFASTG